MCRHAATNCSLSLLTAISFSCVTLAQAVAIKRTVMTNALAKMKSVGSIAITGTIGYDPETADDARGNLRQQV
jgi:hypothetical protein